MGGGVGRGVEDLAFSLPLRDLRGAESARAVFLREEEPIDCNGIRGGGREGAGALAVNGRDAGGVTGSSATRWEPGSARVPTFCAVPLGKASGDGDLPLVGDEGGEPKRESSSSEGLTSGERDIALDKF